MRPQPMVTRPGVETVGVVVGLAVVLALVDHAIVNEALDAAARDADGAGRKRHAMGFANLKQQKFREALNFGDPGLFGARHPKTLHRLFVGHSNLGQQVVTVSRGSERLIELARYANPPLGGLTACGAGKAAKAVSLVLADPAVKGACALQCFEAGERDRFGTSAGIRGVLQGRRNDRQSL